MVKTQPYCMVMVGLGLLKILPFIKSKAAWLEHGGVWATAFIRGGSEYGHTWHKDGRLLNKMNVFDDFAAAADYLAQSGYADSNHLAISGASNGGLLVGASMVLHPENSVSPYQRQACLICCVITIISIPNIGQVSMVCPMTVLHNTSF